MKSTDLLSVVTRLVALEQDNSQQIKLVEKMDATMDRLSELAEAMNKAIAVHEQRILTHETNAIDIKAQMKTQRDETNVSIRDILEKMDASEKRVLAKIEGLETKFDAKLEKKKESSFTFSDVLEAMKRFQWITIAIAMILGILTNKMGMFAWIAKLFVSSAAP